MNQGLLNDNIITEVRKDNCIDFLRYFFATFLIISHFCTLTETANSATQLTGGMRVKAFFVITGFLVTYSFVRGGYNLHVYARKRIARIVPAYIVAIALCVVLGACMSSLQLHEFLSAPATWHYTIANMLMLNWLEPCLPGVFEDNFIHPINGSLWTMKVECIFYVVVPALVWVMRKSHKMWIIAPMTLVCLCFYSNMPKQLMYSMYFLGGMVVLLYLDAFMRHKYTLMVVACLCEVLLYTHALPCLNGLLHSLEPFTFATIIVFIAYNVRPLNFMRKYDNITYGMFLYHWPVIQALVAFGLHRHSIGMCFVATVLITVTLAFISWKCIEQPLMSRK